MLALSSIVLSLCSNILSLCSTGPVQQYASPVQALLALCSNMLALCSKMLALCSKSNFLQHVVGNCSALLVMDCSRAARGGMLCPCCEQVKTPYRNAHFSRWF